MRRQAAHEDEGEQWALPLEALTHLHPHLELLKGDPNDAGKGLGHRGGEDARHWRCRVGVESPSCRALRAFVHREEGRSSRDCGHDGHR
eukprot:scaffold80120_cov37-Tisochrysis_lutea.AAC.3